jgi:hypothetical protein
MIDIKPIPKYVIKRINEYEKKSIYHSSNTRFYSYFANVNKELCEITVAVRSKNKKLYYKQVVIHTVKSKRCFIKDIELFIIAGYVVGWYSEGLSKYKKYYETGRWDEVKDNYFNLYPKLVNVDYLLRKKKYKYSAIDKYTYNDKLKYIRLYEKYPQIEMLTKFGFSQFATKKTILAKVSKDKKFRQWLIANQKELTKLHSYFYASTILLAYSKHLDLAKAQKLEEFKKSFMKDSEYKHIKEAFNNNIERLFYYLKEQNIGLALYKDYLTACEFLGLDMTKNKNLTPHNLQYWHDVRIDEMHSKQAEIDELKRKELYENFSFVANKYEALQRNLKDNFVVIIAKSPQDLIYEGDTLHHCVGRMNYDQKFAREESLIFFVRYKENIETPFVTLEYSLKNHKILQCYADHDSKPSDEVLDYVNKKWLPYANRKIRQIAI